MSDPRAFRGEVDLIDLEEFVATGVFRGLDGRSSTRDVLALGEADLVEAQRRASPAFVVHGDIQFALRDERLVTVTVKFWPDAPTDGGSLEVEGFWPPARRSVAAVGDLLSRAGVTYRLDTLLSDPGSPVWITDRQVHVAFHDGMLERVAAVHGPL